jgi:hypothetical protein
MADQMNVLFWQTIQQQLMATNILASQQQQQGGAAAIIPPSPFSLLAHLNQPFPFHQK